MNLTLIGYTILNDGIELIFKEVDDHIIFFTDAELDGLANLQALRTACIAKLQRKIHKTSIAAKLDPLIGQTITI